MQVHVNANSIGILQPYELHVFYYDPFGSKRFLLIRSFLAIFMTDTCNILIPCYDNNTLLVISNTLRYYIIIKLLLRE